MMIRGRNKSKREQLNEIASGRHGERQGREWMSDSDRPGQAHGHLAHASSQIAKHIPIA